MCEEKITFSDQELTQRFCSSHKKGKMDFFFFLQQSLTLPDTTFMIQRELSQPSAVISAIGQSFACLRFKSLHKLIVFKQLLPQIEKLIPLR